MTSFLNRPWITKVVEPECRNQLRKLKNSQFKSVEEGFQKILDGFVPAVYPCRAQIIKILTFPSPDNPLRVEISDGEIYIKAVISNEVLRTFSNYQARCTYSMLNGVLINIKKFKIQLHGVNQDAYTPHLMLLDFQFVGNEGLSPVGNPKSIRSTSIMDMCQNIKEELYAHTIQEEESLHPMWGDFVTISINDCSIPDNQKDRLKDLQRLKENGSLDDLSQLSDIEIVNDAEKSEPLSVPKVATQESIPALSDSDSDIEQSNSIAQVDFIEQAVTENEMEDPLQAVAESVEIQQDPENDEPMIVQAVEVVKSYSMERLAQDLECLHNALDQLKDYRSEGSGQETDPVEQITVYQKLTVESEPLVVTEGNQNILNQDSGESVQRPESQIEGNSMVVEQEEIDCSSNTERPHGMDVQEQSQNPLSRNESGLIDIEIQSTGLDMKDDVNVEMEEVIDVDMLNTQMDVQRGTYSKEEFLQTEHLTQLAEIASSIPCELTAQTSLRDCEMDIEEYDLCTQKPEEIEPDITAESNSGNSLPWDSLQEQNPPETRGQQSNEFHLVLYDQSVSESDADALNQLNRIALAHSECNSDKCNAQTETQQDSPINQEAATENDYLSQPVDVAQNLEGPESEISGNMEVIANTELSQPPAVDDLTQSGSKAALSYTEVLDRLFESEGSTTKQSLLEHEHYEGSEDTQPAHLSVDKAPQESAEINVRSANEDELFEIPSEVYESAATQPESTKSSENVLAAETEIEDQLRNNFEGELNEKSVSFEEIDTNATEHLVGQMQVEKSESPLDFEEMQDSNISDVVSSKEHEEADIDIAEEIVRTEKSAELPSLEENSETKLPGVNLSEKLEDDVAMNSEEPIAAENLEELKEVPIETSVEHTEEPNRTENVDGLKEAPIETPVVLIEEPYLTENLENLKEVPIEDSVEHTEEPNRTENLDELKEVSIENSFEDITDYVGLVSNAISTEVGIMKSAHTEVEVTEVTNEHGEISGMFDSNNEAEFDDIANENALFGSIKDDEMIDGTADNEDVSCPEDQQIHEVCDNGAPQRTESNGHSAEIENREEAVVDDFEDVSCPEDDQIQVDASDEQIAEDETTKIVNQEPADSEMNSDERDQASPRGGIDQSLDTNRQPKAKSGLIEICGFVFDNGVLVLPTENVSSPKTKKSKDLLLLTPKNEVGIVYEAKPLKKLLYTEDIDSNVEKENMLDENTAVTEKSKTKRRMSDSRLLKSRIISPGVRKIIERDLPKDRRWSSRVIDHLTDRTSPADLKASLNTCLKLVLDDEPAESTNIVTVNENYLNSEKQMPSVSTLPTVAEEVQPAVNSVSTTPKVEHGKKLGADVTFLSPLGELPTAFDFSEDLNLISPPKSFPKSNRHATKSKKKADFGSTFKSVFDFQRRASSAGVAKKTKADSSTVRAENLLKYLEQESFGNRLNHDPQKVTKNDFEPSVNYSGVQSSAESKGNSLLLSNLSGGNESGIAIADVNYSSIDNKKSAAKPIFNFEIGASVKSTDSVARDSAETLGKRAFSPEFKKTKSILIPLPKNSPISNSIIEFPDVNSTESNFISPASIPTDISKMDALSDLSKSNSGKQFPNDRTFTPEFKMKSIIPAEKNLPVANSSLTVKSTVAFPDVNYTESLNTIDRTPVGSSFGKSTTSIPTAKGSVKGTKLPEQVTKAYVNISGHRVLTPEFKRIKSILVPLAKNSPVPEWSNSKRSIIDEDDEAIIKRQKTETKPSTFQFDIGTRRLSGMSLLLQQTLKEKLAQTGSDSIVPKNNLVTSRLPIAKR